MIDAIGLRSAHSDCLANLRESTELGEWIEIYHSECTFRVRGCAVALDCDRCSIFVESGSPRPDVAALIDLPQFDGERQSWMVVEVKERPFRSDTLSHARRQIQSGIIALQKANLLPRGMLVQGFILSRTTPNNAELQVLSKGEQRGFTVLGQKIIPRVLVCGTSLN